MTFVVQMFDISDGLVLFKHLPRVFIYEVKVNHTTSINLSLAFNNQISIYSKTVNLKDHNGME